MIKKKKVIKKNVVKNNNNIQNKIEITLSPSAIILMDSDDFINQIQNDFHSQEGIGLSKAVDVIFDHFQTNQMDGGFYIEAENISNNASAAQKEKIQKDFESLELLTEDIVNVLDDMRAPITSIRERINVIYHEHNLLEDGEKIKNKNDIKCEILVALHNIIFREIAILDLGKNGNTTNIHNYLQNIQLCAESVIHDFSWEIECHKKNIAGCQEIEKILNFVEHDVQKFIAYVDIAIRKINQFIINCQQIANKYDIISE